MSVLTTDPIAEAKLQPIYWFLRLEGAIDNGDSERAAEAQRELRRLGIEVRFHRAHPQTQRQNGD